MTTDAGVSYLQLVKPYVNSDNITIYFYEMNEALYLVNAKGSIDVYNLPPNRSELLEHRYAIKIADNFVPSGFTVCAPNSSLYLSDRLTRRTYRIKVRSNPNVQDEKIDLFVQLNPGEYPQSLSITDNFELAVLVAIENLLNQTWKGRIDVYSKSGEKTSTIPLPPYVTEPWCLTNAGQGCFVVTYGCSQFGVLMIKSDSDVYAEYRGGDLKMPRGVKCDGKDNIYVIDAGNKRVLCLDGKLNLKKVLHKWNGITEDTQPLRIALGDGNKYMYIGMESGKLSLYKITE